MELIQSNNFNYSYEELELLKILAKYPDDSQKALDLIESGTNEYEHPKLYKTLRKFLQDGIWDYHEDDKGIYHSNFKLDLMDLIVNLPNPIPDEYKKDIDACSLIDKLSATNFDLNEIEYLKRLIKKDVIS